MRAKKKLICGRTDPASLARGREVYNYRCYFCHGFSGDARTEAAAMLDPPPRNFTAAEVLGYNEILDALRNGRPGTAMKSFSTLLSPQEMRDVAQYVADVFVACRDQNTLYHTAENGWPDHQTRYATALPFATGEITLDGPAEALTSAQRKGRTLFRSACISCHEGRLDRPDRLVLTTPEEDQIGTFEPSGNDRAEIPAVEGHEAREIGHEDDYETPTIHDFPPDIADLDPEESHGKRLYSRACAQCHAADGSGQNWIGKFLEPSPPDFRADAFARDFAVDRFIAGTLRAPPGTTMPRFADVLSEEEAAAIAAYVRRAFVEHPRP